MWGFAIEWCGGPYRITVFNGMILWTTLCRCDTAFLSRSTSTWRPSFRGDGWLSTILFISPTNDKTIDNPVCEVWFQVLTLSHGSVKMQHKQRLETQVLILIMNHNGGIDILIEKMRPMGTIVKISSCGDSMRRLDVLGARPVNMWVAVCCAC